MCNGIQVNRSCPFPFLICNKQDGPVLCMIISSNLKSSLYCSDFFTVEVACGCLHLVVVFFAEVLIHAFILFLGRWCLLCFLNTTNLSTRCKMEQPMEPAAWKYNRQQEIHQKHLASFENINGQTVVFPFPWAGFRTGKKGTILGNKNKIFLLLNWY